MSDIEKRIVWFMYANYKGETRVRRVRPIEIAFTYSTFHPEPQWILKGLDLDKNMVRSFAMKDIKGWLPGPPPPAKVP
jgi:predicted DNA-binding transcriptional regulator YafY